VLRLDVQRSRHGGEDALVAVVPVDAVARRFFDEDLLDHSAPRRLRRPLADVVDELTADDIYDVVPDLQAAYPSFFVNYSGARDSIQNPF
jgi:hypothetical protein